MYNRLIFLDLDETLIDTSDRHYHVYCDIIKELNLQISLSKDDFWKLKRKGISTIQILEGIDLQILSKFSELWIENIESREYLVYDKLFKDSLWLLSKLSSEKLFLITMRNNRKNLIWELKKLGLYNKFNAVLSCSPLDSHDKTVPILEYIGKNDLFINENSIIVGDSEKDIITGKKLNLTTLAVSYGIRKEEILLSMKPDYCLDNIIAIFNTIKNLD